ncbi:MAG: AI-2E family transporter, partial [Calditrichaceae bacterium]|nr:AI-2E family transporter [Calditrichaceae bacterium]
MEYTVSRIFKGITVVLILAATAWILYTLSSIITIIIISVLIAYILDPVASYFESRNFSRTQSTVIIFILFAIIGAGLFSYFIPAVIDEMSTIQEKINSGDALKTFQGIEGFLIKNLPFISIDDLNLQGRITTAISQLTNSFFMILGSVVSLVTTVIIIPFAVFFLLKDGPAMMKHLFSLIPNRYFEMSLNMMYKIDQQLGGYLRGQFFDALIVGILAILALWILDVKYFFLIGIFAGLSNMIPYVGPMVGGSAAVLVVLMTGGSGITMLLVVVAFLIIQLADNVIIQPLVVARSVDLHPLLIIFSVII